MQRIVLAYSGGLATSIAIPWLADKYGAEVIAVTMDLGQGKEFLQDVRDRALAIGALRAHVVDVRDELARDYLVRALKADLVGHDRSPVAVALARPLVARTLVAIADIEQARTVAHGGKDGCDGPLAIMIRTLDPTLTVLAPAADWGMAASEQVEYARLRHVALPPSIGSLDDRSAQARPSAGLAEEAASIDITIERGVPVAVNGVVMPLLDLIGSLDIIAGAHGVGRMAALHAAHRVLQHATVTSDVESFSTLVAHEYLRILRDGLWFAPMRPALDAYVDKIHERVTGVVRLKLFKGNCAVVHCQPQTAAPRFIAVTKS